LQLKLARFRRNACNFQLEFVQAVLEGKNMFCHTLTTVWAKLSGSGYHFLLFEVVVIPHNLATNPNLFRSIGKESHISG
jgi:hypothetical protein